MIRHTSLAVLLLSAGLASAQTATSLEWDPSPPAEGVTGYRVYKRVVTPGTAPAAPVTTWELVGTTSAPTFTLTTVPPGTTTYAVTAFSEGGESLRSNEVSNTFHTPPRVRVVVTITATATTP